MLKTLIMPLTDVPPRTGALSVGLDLARRLPAHFTGLFIRPDPRSAIPFMGEGMTADAIQQLCDAADRESKALESRAHSVFETAVGEAGLARHDGTDNEGAGAQWETVVGLIADHAGRRARLADLCIVAKPEGEAAEARSEILNEVLFRSGRPLLMVPDRVSDAAFDHVVVAWNGRAEVARALGEAIPMMQEAGRVTVLTLGEEHPDRPSAEQAATYLARHGVEATVRRAPAPKREAGPALIAEIEALGGDMMVMGGYSHSRWREMVLGGVTRTIVNEAPFTVFMSH